jgi:hypothetical protein
MHRKIDLCINLTEKTEFAGAVYAAVTIHYPSENLCNPPVVVFCFPGGGYGRGYFDLQIPNRNGYSQAEHHVRAGLILVACDHLGVGGSSEVDRSRSSYENIAAANTIVVSEVSELIRRGSVAPDLPAIHDPLLIGMGQSFGGMMLIIQQGRQHPFDAVAVLGYSAHHTQVPTPLSTATSMEGGVVRLDRWTPDDYWRYAFFWEDVPKPIVDADMEGGHPGRKPPLPMWASDRRPGGVHISARLPNVVSHWAAVIECPVFVGCGERDVCSDPWSEPGNYGRAKDITLAVIPWMAHMHNFAGTRHELWARLVTWIKGVLEVRHGKVR